MPKQMPEYRDYQDKKTAEQEAVEKKRAAAAKKKADEAEKKKQKKLEEAQKKLETEIYNKKLKIVKKIENKDKPIFNRFLKNFFIGQMGLFVMGSALFWLESGARDDKRFEKWARLTYWEAFKSAYGIKNSNHPFADNTVYYTLFFTAIIMCISIMIPKIQNDDEAKRHLSQLELLKQFDIDIKLRQFGMDIKKMMGDLQPIYNKMLASLSEIDRGYFDNLTKGGLDEASYETCVAIVSGYLKSHPKEYNQVIAIIDEATLPPEIVEKYGKGKTISLAAAQAMQK